MICDTCIHKEVCYEKEEDRRALRHCSDYFNFAEELEKIKENIQFIAEKCLPNNLAEEFEVKGLKTSIEIIDNRIVELKGEDK